MPAVTTPPYRGATVSVRAINSTADLVCKTDTICKPRIPGHESLNLPTVVWLIEHGTTKTNVLFDCGVRKDFHTFSSTSVKVLQSCVPHMHVPYDVRDVLDRNEISCDGLGMLLVLVLLQAVILEGPPNHCGTCSFDHLEVSY